MKCAVVCLAVFCMVALAMAGDDPYIAIVGNDITANLFYFEPIQASFLFDQTVFSVPVCSAGTAPTTSQTDFSLLRAGGGAGCEGFLSQTPLSEPEICDPLGAGSRGVPNAAVRAGNAGFFEWWIRLPKRPSGAGINIVVECGVVGPNAFESYGFDAVNRCSAETGERIVERIVAILCVRQAVDPGVNPVIQTALPRLTAVAYPGPYSVFTPFHLTAYKNPNSYAIAFDPITSAMSNNTNSQVLDGSSSARILLKACMDMTVFAKLPVTGQLNACSNGFIPSVDPLLPSCFGGGSEVEADLDMGDIIRVRLDIPPENTVDIYCHAQSARLQGVGESHF